MNFGNRKSETALRREDDDAPTIAMPLARRATITLRS